MSEAQYKGFETPSIEAFSPCYGEPQLIAKDLYRITAANITPFTQTGTNSFCLVDDRHTIIIDPGPCLDSHLEALKRFFTKHPLTHILVTHTHIDHSPLTQSLLALYPNAKTYGFGVHPAYDENSAFRNSGDYDFRPDDFLVDKQRLIIGDFIIDVMHTPGHLSNHLAFKFPQYRSIFCGDIIMAGSSVLIAPPDGNMTDYMQSLENISACKDIEILYPGHGPSIRNPYVYCQSLIKHRKKREKQIIDIMYREKKYSLHELSQEIYGGLSEKLKTAARLTVLAHMDKLCLEKKMRYDKNNRVYYFLER